MNQAFPHQADILEARFGQRVASRLDLGTAELPHDISERLRVARQQAVARRKRVATAPRLVAGAQLQGQGTLALGGGDEPPLWGRLVGALPLLALLAGLVVLNVTLNEDRAREVAEVDAALLTDDLPPQAYTDPGFLQFLKASSHSSVNR